MISVNNISKKFNDKTILNNISINIKKGEIICIIGPSGSGKSTFLRCLNRMEEIDEGDILYGGKSIFNKSYPIEEVRKSMGMVFQQFNLFPHLTVLENITLGPVTLKMLAKDEANKKALELLELVGLKDKAYVYPSTLSGGQKQRVAIARALAMSPNTILFDEPTSALDPEMVLEVLQVIQNLANQGITMIIVTHQINFARNIASRILFIDNGRIEVDGSPEEIFNNQENQRLNEFLSKIESI